MAMMLERGLHVDHTTIYHSRAPAALERLLHAAMQALHDGNM